MTLRGTVVSDAARVLASHDIADVGGARTVLNDLTVSTGTPVTAAATAAAAIPDRTQLFELPARTQTPVHLQAEIDTETAENSSSTD